MRQLKFRVFDFFKKCWVKSWVDHCSQSITFLPEESDTDEHTVEFFDAFNGSEFIFQQFIGLKDKNNKEIYEGDILHHVFDGASYPKEARDEILTCVWGKHSGLYSFENHNAEYYWAEIANRCEVIGNIFENPELLEA